MICGYFSENRVFMPVKLSGPQVAFLPVVWNIPIPESRRKEEESDAGSKCAYPPADGKLAGNA
jgi:hypothetical protein